MQYFEIISTYCNTISKINYLNSYTKKAPSPLRIVIRIS